MALKPIGVRWTIGDVSAAGFEALQFSIWSAWNVFGDRADYAVCVNTIAVDAARSQAGPVPGIVRWLEVTERVPEWLKRHVDPQMAEGVAWKFAPVRLFPEAYEISFDNDVILWTMPEAMRWWLEDGSGCLLAEDVQRCFGQFSNACDCGPVNSGIRGLPPGFDLEARLRDMLRGVVMRSELDEQGLQACALCDPKMFLVSTRDVSICSPFPAHQQRLGQCGVHFVGLNAKRSPWTLDGRPAVEVVREHWKNFKPDIAHRMIARTR
jgi:hypothetical protein